MRKLVHDMDFLDDEQVFRSKRKTELLYDYPEDFDPQDFEMSGSLPVESKVSLSLLTVSLPSSPSYPTILISYARVTRDCHRCAIANRAHRSQVAHEYFLGLLRILPQMLLCSML